MACDILGRFLPLILFPDSSDLGRAMRSLTIYLTVTHQRKHLLDLGLKLLGEPSHILSTMNVLFPKYLGFNTATEDSHQKPSPLTLKYVCTAEKFFWF